MKTKDSSTEKVALIAKDSKYESRYSTFSDVDNQSSSNTSEQNKSSLDVSEKTDDIEVCHSFTYMVRNCSNIKGSLF